MYDLLQTEMEMFETYLAMGQATLTSLILFRVLFKDTLSFQTLENIQKGNNDIVVVITENEI